MNVVCIRMGVCVEKEKLVFALGRISCNAYQSVRGRTDH